MTAFQLGDVWMWWGKCAVRSLPSEEVLYTVRCSGGFVSRVKAEVFDRDGRLVAMIRNPKVATPYHRDALTTPEGQQIGLVEPRLTLEKSLNHSRQTFSAYGPKGRLFWKGAHVADIVFKGRSYVSVAYFPGYREIVVTDERDHVVMKMKRDFVLSPWIDYFLLKHFYEKSIYRIDSHEGFESTEDMILFGLMIRQFYRHLWTKRT